jgi:hypothetical protein
MSGLGSNWAFEGVDKNRRAHSAKRNMGRRLNPLLSRCERGGPPATLSLLHRAAPINSCQDADTEILGASARGSRAEHSANTEILDAVRVQNDDTRISGQGFHEDFDLEMVGASGHVHGAEDERFGEGEGCFSLEF